MVSSYYYKSCIKIDPNRYGVVREASAIQGDLRLLGHYIAGRQYNESYA